MPQKVFIMGTGVLARRLFLEIFNDTYSGSEIVGIGDCYGNYGSNNQLVAQFAYNLEFDTIYGRADLHQISSDNYGHLIIDGKEINCYAATDPNDIPNNMPLGNLGVDVVIDCSGVRDDGSVANNVYAAGGKITLATVNPTPTAFSNQYNGTRVVTPVNDTAHGIQCVLADGDLIARAVICKIINDQSTVDSVYIDIRKSNTNYGYVQDYPNGSADCSGRAADNVMYEGTYNASEIGQIIPELNGKVIRSLTRVNNKNVNSALFHFFTSHSETVGTANGMIKNASGDVSKYIEYTEKDIVSSDYNGYRYIGVTASRTSVVGPTGTLHYYIYYDYIMMQVKNIKDYLYNHTGDF